MRSDPIPAELLELEKRTFGRTEIEPSAALRDRVMQAVADELASPAGPPPEQVDARYWAAIAATVLLLMTLSMVFASQDEYSVWSTPTKGQAAAEHRLVQVMLSQLEGKPQ